MSAQLHKGEGERLTQSRQRRRMMIFAGLFITGVVIGIYGGRALAKDGFDIAAPWTPAASLLFTGLYLAAIVIGSLLLSKNTDEIQRQSYYKMSSLAGSVYMIVYPCWFMLWKGGFVIEPSHWMLFILFWLSLVVGSVVYRLR